MDDETVHVGKGLCIVHIFHLFLGGAKGALIPFLGIYFRQLGLTATHVGIVFAIKAFMWMWSAPLWTTCAKCCNKKKVVLVFSLLMLLITTVALSFVPPADEKLPKAYCDIYNGSSTPFSSIHLGTNPTGAGDLVTNRSILLNSESSTRKDETTPITMTTVIMTTEGSNIEDINSEDDDDIYDMLRENGLNENEIEFFKKHPGKLDTLLKHLVEDTPRPKSDDQVKGHSGSKRKPNRKVSRHKRSLYDESSPSAYSENDDPDAFSEGEDTEDYDYYQYSLSDTIDSDDTGDIFTENVDDEGLESNTGDIFTENDDDEGLESNTGDIFTENVDDEGLEDNDLSSESNTDVLSVDSNDTATEVDQSVKESDNDFIATNKAMIYDFLNQLKDPWGRVRGSLGLSRMQETLAMLCILIVISEVLSAPTEKMADDCWFEYLDLIDAVERYGNHKAWAIFGALIFAPVAAFIVESTPCLFWKNIPHMIIHFFVFAGLVAIAFLLSFGYPVSQKKRTPKRARLDKGLRVLCSDSHSVTFTLTLIIMGAVYGVLLCFLFWQMQDLGGSEIEMGIAVAVGALSELIIYPMRNWIISHITNAGALLLGVIMLAGRMLFYSFAWSPMMIIFGEALQGFSGVLFWNSVTMYQEFRINPIVMDRGAYAISNALYYGVGIGSGSLVAGFLYDYVGFAVLFQACCILLSCWCVLFLLVQKFIKKENRIRYTKLLQDDGADSGDEDTIFNGDWLDVAMAKDSKRKIHDQ